MTFKDRLMTIQQRVNSSPWAAAAFTLVLLIPVVIIWLCSLPFSTDDLSISIVQWVLFIESHGYWRAFQYAFANYAPAYLYVLLIIAYLQNIPTELVIKAASILCDIGMAILVYQIVKTKFKTRFYPILASIAVLVSPVVWMDSALWGQCDSFFGLFVVGFVWLMIKKRPVLAMLSFAIAFAFKPTAILIAPFIGVLIFRKQIPWWTLVLVPAVYIVFILPAWFAGRSFMDLLTIYFTQDQWSPFHRLSMNAANLYVFFPTPGLSSLPGVLIAGVGSLLFFITALKKKLTVTPVYLVIFSMFTELLMVFLLPTMHERYFYCAALFALVTAFYRKEFIWLAVLLQITTTMSYFPFLFSASVVWVEVAAVINTIAVGIMVYCFLAWSFPQIKKPSQGWLGKMFVWQEE
jgi:Gpi18-like mannosyltransferase